MSRNSYQVGQLLIKMKNPDQDFRFMALNDLIVECEREGFSIDDNTEGQTVEGVLELMKDTNAEVKNKAVQTLGVLVKKVQESRMAIIIDRLTAFSNTDDEALRDISSLALKTVTNEITFSSKLAPQITGKLTPQLINQLSSASTPPEQLIASTELLSDILLRFDSSIRANVPLQKSALAALTKVLKSPRGAIRKRAVVGLGNLVACSERSVFEELVEQTILPYLKNKGNTETLKTAVAAVGSVARASPKRVGRRVNVLVPLVVAAKDNEDDELKETVLQTLETLLSRCPAEITSFVPQITEAGVSLLKYDPNYAGDEDEDVDMEDQEDEEEEEEDDEFGDEYSDDDDLSWKVRRAATKLLTAAITTRPELLSSFYRGISPALIQRFGEREESVRVEVWATYSALLAQTKVWGGGISKGTNEGSLKKRKREDEGVVDAGEDGPIGLLRSQVTAIGRSITKQLGTKSVTTRQAGFNLLYNLLSVLPNGLDGQVAPLIPRVEAALKTADSSASGLATNLKIEVLRFLALFFETHNALSFSDHLPKLAPLLTSVMADKFHKIASGAFVTTAALVTSLRPIGTAYPPGSEEQVHILYEATVNRLKGSDTDTEVKEKAITALGEMLVHMGDYLQTDFSRALSVLSERLNSEVTTFVTVGVLAKVAASPLCTGQEFGEWLKKTTLEVAAFLKKNNRPLKLQVFNCLSACLQRCGHDLSHESCTVIVKNIEPLLLDSDPNILPLAISNLGIIVSLHPHMQADVRDRALLKVYDLLKSPHAHGATLQALVDFYGRMVDAGQDPRAIIDLLARTVGLHDFDVGKTGSAAVANQAFAAAAKCIGVVITKKPQNGDEVASTFAQNFTAPNFKQSTVYFSLLVLGEIGRVIDFAKHQGIYNAVIQAFASPVEDLRSAAAFAAGNIAVGNPPMFLPNLVGPILNDEKKRYLGLQALKEFITHLPPQYLVTYSQHLWTPLFTNSESEEEVVRNLAAECLGKLSLADPASFLPLLQERLKSPSPRSRSAVIAAIRFTFVDESALDEHLAPVLVSFLSLMRDPDLDVRRAALSTLNSAARNKPQLLREQLQTLLPILYERTEVDKSLIRLVTMGPFTHKVDDGLDARKSAFECMYTFLDAFLTKLDLNPFMDRISAALTDEDEIKVLAYLMLIKLSDVAPAAVVPRLDGFSQPFIDVLNQKPKESSVKQEIEKMQELQNAALRCLATLAKLSSPATTPKFQQLVVSQESGPNSLYFRELLKANSA
ncbi:TIP120-domain-containing protein [Atractiella rhizophila]|nr:TIP120-domain-containing protein [Atractiella rhizophila]